MMGIQISISIEHWGFTQHRAHTFLFAFPCLLKTVIKLCNKRRIASIFRGFYFVLSSFYTFAFQYIRSILCTARVVCNYWYLSQRSKIGPYLQFSWKWWWMKEYILKKVGDHWLHPSHRLLIYFAANNIFYCHKKKVKKVYFWPRPLFHPLSFSEWYHIFAAILLRGNVKLLTSKKIFTQKIQMTWFNPANPWKAS